jgi:hypothetical protein
MRLASALPPPEFKKIATGPDGERKDWLKAPQTCDTTVEEREIQGLLINQSAVQIAGET